MKKKCFGWKVTYAIGDRFQSASVHSVIQGWSATVQAQCRRIVHRLMELFGTPIAGGGRSRFPVDGLAGRERSAGARGGGARPRQAVQVRPGVFAGGKHGTVLPGVLQQDDLAVVPLFSVADAVQGGGLAGVPEHQPAFLRGGGGRVATGRHPVDPGLSPDAVAGVVAREVPGIADRFFPAHPVSIVGDLPDAAAGVAGGDHRGIAGLERHRVPYARLREPFFDIGIADGGV